MSESKTAEGRTVPKDSSVYYSTGYWNDLPGVANWMEERATGKANTRWFNHLKHVTGGQRFRKGLFLNCGNGWVERDLLAAGVVGEAVGVDISEDLLSQARESAGAKGLDARYYAQDVNAADFPETGFDLVVNYAAAHHVAYIDRVFRRVAELLPDNGVFVSFDYIGPHRNQYPYDQWQAAVTLNRNLPADFRSEMSYPHLPTMLATDPTEAIHSELILRTFCRYFTLDEYNPIGGGLAYLVLTFNSLMHSNAGPERDALIARVLSADTTWTTAHGAMFAFFWGRPQKAVLGNSEVLAGWVSEEAERERRAAANRGEYYPRTVLQELILEIASLRSQLARAGEHGGTVQRRASDNVG